MRSAQGFIVTPSDGEIYKNKKTVGSVEFILSSSMENHKVVNRLADIQTVPAGYTGPVKDGAVGIVHHNIFRKTIAYGGKEKFATALFGDGKYIVPEESIYAYKNPGDSCWSMIDPWCFVKPNDDMLGGVVKIGELYNGETVVFIPDSEYEFNVDGEILYRVDTKDICLVKK